MAPRLLLVAGIGSLFVALVVGAKLRGPSTAAISCSTTEECTIALGASATCHLSVTGHGECRAGLPSPPSAELATALALGRPSVAADVAWLRIVQFVGAPWAERVSYAGLGPWLSLATELDPSFRTPYLVGGALLSTSPGNAAEADAILARGEERFEDRESLRLLAQWRAFVSYYGMLDPATAAEHYRRAYELGGPPLFLERAQTLGKSAADCREVWNSLSTAVEGLQGDPSGRLLANRGLQKSILQNCFRESIHAAMASYLLAEKRRAEGVEELVTAGILTTVPPTLEEGKCWHIIEGKAHIRACSTASAPSPTPSPAPGEMP